MKYIVGVSGYFHDSSVCLLKDGNLIEFIKEEFKEKIATYENISKEVYL